MANTHETIADIIAWLRKPIEDENAYLTLWRDEIADRLEAAHKREIEATAAKCCQLGRLAGYGASEIKHQQEPVGDAAKLREALEYLRDASREFCHLILNSKYNEVFDKYKYAEVAKIRDAIANANAALAEPPRNCDIYATVEEARKVWCGKPSRDWDYLCDWLYATTKETEVQDGSK